MLSTCLREAGMVLAYGELGNAGRRVFGLEEGHFFVDKLSLMYLRDSRMAVSSNHLNIWDWSMNLS